MTHVTSNRTDNSPRSIGPTPGHRQHAGRAGQPPTFQVIQQADGRLNTRRLKAASPLQTVAASSNRQRVLNRRAGILVLVLALVVLAFLAGAASARGEALVQESIVVPVCQVSAPPPPLAPASEIHVCVEPRVYLPMIFGVSNDRSSRTLDRADAGAAAGSDREQASAIRETNSAPAASVAGEDKGSGSLLR